MDAGEQLNARSTDSSELGAVRGRIIDGEKETLPAVSQTDSHHPAVCDSNEAALTKDEREFSYKIEHLTSSLLAVLCFVLNWYSVYRGHPVYVPEWVIGLMLGGYGATAYKWLRDKILAK